MVKAVRSVKLALQLQRFAVIRLRHGDIADLRIERGSIIQKRRVGRMLVAQLFAQQLSGFVVQFFGGRIVAQIGLQIRVTHQARRIGRMIHAGLHP